METTKCVVQILNEKIEEISKTKNISKKKLITQLVDLMALTICDGQSMFKLIEDSALDNSERFIKSGAKYYDGVPNYLTELSIYYLMAVSKAEPFTDILGCLYFDMDMNNDPVLDQYTNVYSDISYDATNLIIDVFNTKSGFVTLSMLRNINREHGIDGLKSMDVKINDSEMLHTKMATVQIMKSCVIHKLQLDRLTSYSENKISLQAKHDYMFMFDIGKHEQEIISELNRMFG